MHIEAIGVFCFGLFLGYLCWYFVVRIPQGKVTADSFASVAGVVAGGVVVDLLKTYLAHRGNAWWYPIGLVAGLALYALVSLINRRTRGGESIVDRDGAVMPTALGLFKPPGAGPDRQAAPPAGPSPPSHP